ncbi:hypothetical protein DFQ28_005670 [Apophysomyces sp. BC1034]|nr:hypothetical protein DFQ29_005458 [Apophysomyces sp. BC1021]KAG0187920.1 hypothetical protein DFQ28_005670 [Apophysomyces sp. BC1034]
MPHISNTSELSKQHSTSGVMMPNTTLHIDNALPTNGTSIQNVYTQPQQLQGAHTVDSRFPTFSQQAAVNQAAFELYMSVLRQNTTRLSTPSATPVMSPAQPSFTLPHPPVPSSHQIRATSPTIHQSGDTIVPSSPSTATGPSTPIAPVPIHAQKQKDETEPPELLIYERNNLRLNQMEKEVRQFVTYGPACDEFLVWLQDQRAYNQHNETAMMRCATAVHEQALEYGAWSGLRIINTIYSFRKNLSEKSQAQIVQWRNELMSASFGQAPSTPTSVQHNVIPNIHHRQPSQTHVSVSSQPHVSVPSQSHISISSPSYPSSTPVSHPRITYPATVSHMAHAHQPIQNTVSFQTPQMFTSYMMQSVPSVSQQRLPSHNTAKNAAIIAFAQAPPQITTPAEMPQPRQPQQPQTETPQPQQPQTEISQSQQPKADSSSFSRHRLTFKRKVDYAVKPFRLQHKKMHTRTPFFISAEFFRRMWKDDSVKIAMDASSLPILYVLTAWRVGQNSTKCEWPETIAIEINGKLPKLSKRIKSQTEVPGRPVTVSYVGKDRPLNLGPYLVQGSNELVVHQYDCACSYYFCIQIELQETEDIIKRSVLSRTLSIEVVQNLINSRLGKLQISNQPDTSRDDDEIEIHQQHYRMSLKCPISLLRIQQPVRGEDCKHPDCFDLQSYLVINQDSITWKCPHCNECTPPNKLSRDLFFEDLLIRVPKNANEVEFTESCDNWKVTKSEIADGDEDIDDEDGETVGKTLPKSVCARRNPLPATGSPVSLTDPNVISLLSDDEEEDSTFNLSRKRRASPLAARSESGSVDKSPTTPSFKRRTSETQLFENNNLLMPTLLTIPRPQTSKLDDVVFGVPAASTTDDNSQTRIN